MGNNGVSVKTKPAQPEAGEVASPLRCSKETIQELTEVFKMLADPSRLAILLALAQDGELHVRALCELLGDDNGQPCSQPAVSHHLTLMRMARLVAYTRHGKHNYYRLASSHLRDLLERFFSEQGTRALQVKDFSLSFKRK